MSAWGCRVREMAMCVSGQAHRSRDPWCGTRMRLRPGRGGLAGSPAPLGATGLSGGGSRLGRARQTNLARPGRARTNLARANLAQMNLAQTNLVRTDASRTAPSRTAPSRNGPTRNGPDRNGPDRAAAGPGRSADGRRGRRTPPDAQPQTRNPACPGRESLPRNGRTSVRNLGRNSQGRRTDPGPARCRCPRGRSPERRSRAPGDRLWRNRCGTDRCGHARSGPDRNRARTGGVRGQAFRPSVVTQVRAPPRGGSPGRSPRVSEPGRVTHNECNGPPCPLCAHCGGRG